MSTVNDIKLLIWEFAFVACSDLRRLSTDQDNLSKSFFLHILFSMLINVFQISK